VFSPDGQKLALDISDGKQRDIWVYEWATDTATQLTFDPAQDAGPHWSPDGRRLLFTSDRAKTGIGNLYWMNADGTGNATRLTESSQSQVASSWHPSGKFVAYMEQGASPTQLDLMTLPLEDDAVRGWVPGTPKVFVSNPATKVLPAFSPDGRWIAYVSNEGGGDLLDVYVRPFPGPGGMWRVSYGGGGFPHWSRVGRELLFFKSPNVMVAPYEVAGDSFSVVKPRPWTETSIRGVGLPSPYDIHPDGKRLAVVGSRDEGTAVRDTVVLVFNFVDYLRKLAPGTN
jgi:Tol biopolymer transport system component